MTNSEYTPTTEAVRAAYAPTPGMISEYSRLRKAQFDRWLAEVIRENRAIGWDQGFEAGERDVMEHNRTSWSADCTANPHRGDN